MGEGKGDSCGEGVNGAKWWGDRGGKGARWWGGGVREIGVSFASATVVAFVLLRNYSINYHSYTQREATPTQKSARK